MKSPDAAAPRVHQSGFTLIEVMISLFVLAVMAGMAWQGVDMVVRSREASRARTESVLRLQSVITQWELDLKNLVATDVAPGFEVQGNVMRVTRQTPQGIQVVAWSLRGGSWYRWASPVGVRADTLQEAWLSSYQLLGNEPGTLRALAGVADLQLYTFYTGSGWGNAQSSPGAGEQRSNKNLLPDGVRMVIGFQAEAVSATGAPNAASGAGMPSGSGPITRTVQLVHP